MEIKCAECSNGFFTKQMKLKKLLGQNDIIEEIYYTCSGCGLTVAKKDVKNFPIVNGEILLYRDRD